MIKIVEELKSTLDECNASLAELVSLVTDWAESDFMIDEYDDFFLKWNTDVVDRFVSARAALRKFVDR